MREILTGRGFTETEVTTLEAREDYELIKLKVERLQADSLLDDLEAKTEKGVESITQSLDDRWNTFKEAIEKLELSEQIPENSVSPSDTLKEVRTKMKVEAIETAETAIKAKFSGIPLIGESIADWFITTGKEQVLTDIDGNGAKKKNWIFMLIAGFFGVGGILKAMKSGVDAAKIAELDIPEASNPLSPKLEVNDKTANNLKYEAGITLILGLSDKDDNNVNVRSILENKSLRAASFNSVMSPSFTIKDVENKDLIATQATIKSQEGLIDSILKSENPDWRELTLLEIFEAISMYAESFGDLENISAENILSGDFSIGSLSFSESGDAGGSLGTLLQRYSASENSVFYGVNSGLLMSLYRQTNKKITESDVEALLGGNIYQTEKPDVKFQKEFVEFGRGFVGLISSEFYLGSDKYKTEFTDFFTSRSLTYKEVLEIMVLTGGSLDSSSYNDAVKTIIYTKIWKMLGEQEEGYGNPLRRNTYNHVLIQNAGDKASKIHENVPSQFINLGNKLLERAYETANNGLEELVDKGMEVLITAWKESSLQYRAGLVGGSAIALFIIIKMRYTRGAVAGVTGLSTAALFAGIVGLASQAHASPEFSKKYPDLDSQEKILSTFISELQANGVDLSAQIDDLKTGRTPYTDIDAALVNQAPEVLNPKHEDTSDSSQNKAQNIPQITEKLTTEDAPVETIPKPKSIKLPKGMEQLSSTSETLGGTKVEINNGEVTLSYNGKERKLFFQSTLIPAPAMNIININPFFSKNKSGELFLAAEVERGEYKFIPLSVIQTRLSSGKPEIVNNAGIPEYKIYDKFFRNWSLYIDGEVIS